MSYFTSKDENSRKPQTGEKTKCDIKCPLRKDDIPIQDVGQPTTNRQVMKDTKDKEATLI